MDGNALENRYCTELSFFMPFASAYVVHRLTMAENKAEIDRYRPLFFHDYDDTTEYTAFQLPSIQMERPVNCRHDLTFTASDPQRTERVVWCHPIAMIFVWLQWYFCSVTVRALKRESVYRRRQWWQPGGTRGAERAMMRTNRRLGCSRSVRGRAANRAEKSTIWLFCFVYNE